MPSKRELLDLYMDETSLHGIPDTYKSKSWSLGCIWFIITMGAVGGLVYEIWLLCIDYRDSPLITEYKMTSASQLRFPVIQVCPNQFVSTKEVVKAGFHPAAVDYARYMMASVTEKTVEKYFTALLRTFSKYSTVDFATIIATTKSATEAIKRINEIVPTADILDSIGVTMTSEEIQLNTYFNAYRQTLEDYEFITCMRNSSVSGSECEGRQDERVGSRKRLRGRDVVGALEAGLASGLTDPSTLLLRATAASQCGQAVVEAGLGVGTPDGRWAVRRTLGAARAAVEAGAGPEDIIAAAAEAAEAADPVFDTMEELEAAEVLYEPEAGERVDMTTAEDYHYNLIRQITLPPQDFTKFIENIGVKLSDFLVSCSWKGNGDPSSENSTSCDALARPTFDEKMGLCFTFDQPSFNRIQTIEGLGLVVVVGVMAKDRWRAWPAATAGVEVRIMDQYEPLKFTSLSAPLGSLAKINLRGTKMELMEGAHYNICHSDIPRSVFNSVHPYSDTFCRAECFFQRAKEECGCLPVVPQELLADSTPPCISFPDMFCISPLFYGGGWEKNGGLECVQKCKPACQYWDYTPIVTYSSFPSMAFQKWYTLEGGNLDVGKNYLALDIAFARLQYTELTQKMSITVNGFISQIGGVPSLVDGRMVELLLYLARCFGPCLEPKKTTPNASRKVQPDRTFYGKDGDFNCPPAPN